MEAVVGPDQLELAVDVHVVGIATADAGEHRPRVDQLDVGPLGRLGQHDVAQDGEAAGEVRRLGVRDPDPDERSAVGGQVVHHRPDPPAVLGRPLGRGHVVALAVHLDRLGVVAAEGDHHDLRVDLLHLLLDVLRPVEEVGAGEPRRDLVVEHGIDHAGLAGEALQARTDGAGVRVPGDVEHGRVVRGGRSRGPVGHHHGRDRAWASRSGSASGSSWAPRSDLGPHRPARCVVVVASAAKDPSPPWSLPRSASTRSPGRSKRRARLTSYKGLARRRPTERTARALWHPIEGVHHRLGVEQSGQHQRDRTHHDDLRRGERAVTVGQRPGPPSGIGRRVRHRS